MNQKKTFYEGIIDALPQHQIVLNVKHLGPGTYTLKIMHSNKIIKQTTFKK